jgi:muramoyltetrapeptide carboxypeptidase
VRLAPHALNQHGHISDTPENRAWDINQMFADPQVKMILAAIGGDHSCQLLPHLDYTLIRQNPKIFMGFSDITVLNVALWSRIKLVTFNGPALLTDFAEYPRMQEYSERNFLKVVTAIFFFETSEDKPSPETVDGILADYENMGVLDQIKGMLVGRPMRYSDDEKRQLHEVILERTQTHHFPIIAEMDFGHTTPQFTLPIGCQALIDAESRRFEILESAVI